ncbi:amidohydrolase family protein [Pedobacter sp. MC2016-14]|uniref:amidohydrolase family protein n=1 Tax=Pedobacter sp. MC2016-14 TaxID=2897327 RepID=UPI001E5596A1|nr:amidohydrolase family protein [Pedobacter sp. MC2016-14]MCD0488390.1 amidohydrolase family protein [Pedobacter sp. MC2016-14]
MKRFSFILAIHLLTVVSVLAASNFLPKATDTILVLKNANILDANGAQFIKGKDLIIANGKIRSLRLSKKELKGAKTIDLQGKFIIPGLIDAHVHVTANRKNNIENTYNHLNYFLRHGITSLRDAGGDGAALLKAQKEIKEGNRRGADVYFSSFMAGDWYYNRDQHLRNEPYAPWEQLIVPGTNLDSAMSAAKACGATGVKLYHSFDKDFLPLVIKAAKKHGLLVWGHTMLYPATPIEVVTAGMEVLSHVYMLENLTTDTLFFRRKTPAAYKDSVIANLDIDAFCRMMRKKNAILDATLCVSEEQSPWIFPLLKRVHEQGVAVATGTDQIVDTNRLYPRLLDEIRYFVEKCGFSNVDALRAATIVGAKVIGQEKNIGSIENGKNADLLVLSENPLIDVNSLKKQVLVIKHGKVIYL